VTALAVVLSLFAGTTLVLATGDLVSGASEYEWCWRVAGLETECHFEPGPQTYAIPPACVRSVAVVRAWVGGAPEPWQDASAEIVSQHLEGDLNFDGVVGGPDFALLGASWGNSCP